MTKTTKYHTCVAVRPQLRGTLQEIQRRWQGAIIDDNGKTLMSGQEIRTFWEDQLVQGREVIPTGNECDNFDYKKGCQGHPEDKK